MTATRDPDRLLRAWLDLMPDEAPDRVVSAVLQATRGASQVRALPWDGIRRTTRMNRLILIAATALVAVAVIGGAVMFVGSFNGPTPTVAPPSITPAPTREVADAPDPLIWGDWVADVESLAGIQQPAGRIQLSVDWEDGLTVWIQQDATWDQRWVLESMSYPAGPNELRVRSLATIGCDTGTEGRYGWNRSADGLFLTMTAIEDECPNRAAALARTWVHSHGAVNDGGPGVNFAVTPMIQMTLPTGQRYGMGGGEGAPEIKTFGDAEPFRAFVVIENPGGFGAPCSTTDTQKIDIAHTTDAFVTYVEGLPGATVTTASSLIGGRPAVQLDVAIDTAVECASGSIEAFHPWQLSDTFSWTFAPGEAQALYIVEMDATNTFLLWYQGPVAESQSVLDSIQFIDELPTP